MREALKLHEHRKFDVMTATICIHLMINLQTVQNLAELDVLVVLDRAGMK